MGGLGLSFFNSKNAVISPAIIIRVHIVINILHFFPDFTLDIFSSLLSRRAFLIALPNFTPSLSSLFSSNSINLFSLSMLDIY